MCNDDFLAVYALIDRTLITIEPIVDMLKDLVLMAVQYDLLFLTRGASTDSASLDKAA